MNEDDEHLSASSSNYDDADYDPEEEEGAGESVNAYLPRNRLNSIGAITIEEEIMQQIMQKMVSKDSFKAHSSKYSAITKDPCTVHLLAAKGNLLKQGT
jgi:hypothetical protein